MKQIVIVIIIVIIVCRMPSFNIFILFHWKKTVMKKDY